MSAWLPLHPHWPRLRAGQSLVLALPAACFDGLQPSLEIGGLLLRRKREFHVTVLDGASCAALQVALQALPRARARRWRAEAMALDWRWRRGGERWLVARRGGGRPTAHSLIELLEQPAQALFRARAGQLLGRALPPPLPHVTLYTRGDPVGIGLPDPDTFAARAVRRLA